MRVGVTGHQRLPDGVARFVIGEVRRKYAGVPELVVVSSLAAGADQLVAAALQRMGGLLEVVIPCAAYESTFDVAESRESYRSLLASAALTRYLPYTEPSEEAFLAAGRQVVEASDEVVAVWDGLPPRGLGGTADVVTYARSRAVPVLVLWPEGAMRT